MLLPHAAAVRFQGAAFFGRQAAHAFVSDLDQQPIRFFVFLDIVLVGLDDFQPRFGLPLPHRAAQAAQIPKPRRLACGPRTA